MVSFRGKTPPAWVLEGVRRGEIGSFCLFRYNINSPRGLRELTTALHGAALEGGQPPPLIGIDQEGGQLMAVTGGATELPGNMALGATRSPKLAEAAGRVLARELLAMGCNLNFAPVLDLSLNMNNPAVSVRAFSDDPAVVAELGCALIRGMQAVGVVATAKHFPGHGDTNADSHHATPVIDAPLEVLRARDLVPFRAAIREGVGAIMSAHVTYPALDAAPATVSRRILTELLRDELGFAGLVITDAMDMQGVAHLDALGRNLAALEAGADLMLFGHLEDQPGLIRELTAHLQPEAMKRVQRAREGLPKELLPFDIVGCTEHQEVARKIAEASITLVRDEGRLPLKLQENESLTVITVTSGDLTPADTSSSVTVRLADTVRARHPNTQALALPYGASDEAIREVLEAASGASTVIVGSVNASADRSQTALVRAFTGRGQRLIVVALRAPYDLTAFPNVRTYLCAYSVRDVSTEAAAKVLFGEIPARGKLPVSIPEAVAV